MNSELKLMLWFPQKPKEKKDPAKPKRAPKQVEPPPADDTLFGASAWFLGCSVLVQHPLETPFGTTRELTACCRCAGTVKYYPGSIPVAAREWVERFQANKDGALAELFEFVVRVSASELPFCLRWSPQMAPWGPGWRAAGLQAISGVSAGRASARPAWHPCRSVRTRDGPHTFVPKFARSAPGPTFLFWSSLCRRLRRASGTTSYRRWFPKSSRR